MSLRAIFNTEKLLCQGQGMTTILLSKVLLAGLPIPNQPREIASEIASGPNNNIMFPPVAVRQFQTSTPPRLSYRRMYCRERTCRNGKAIMWNSGCGYECNGLRGLDIPLPRYRQRTRRCGEVATRCGESDRQLQGRLGQHTVIMRWSERISASGGLVTRI